MVYLDFRSLCLIFACGTWAGARAGAWSHTAVDLRSLSLIGAIRPGGTRAEGGGEGAQVGRGGEHRWEGGRGVKGDRDFKF
jgi:hypothetical protein